MAKSTLRLGVEKHLAICGMCNGTYRQPKILPCYHINCLPCLEAKVGRRKQFNCTVCDGEIIVPQNGLKALPDFVSIDHLTKLINQKVIKCSKHDKMAAALHCKTCNASYCDPCVAEHRINLATKTHSFESVNECGMRDYGQKIPPRPQEIRSIKALKDVISAITLHNEILIALSCIGEYNDVFIYGTDEDTAAHVRKRIFKACPKPFKIMSLFPFSNKIAVVNYDQDGIKVVSMDKDEIEFIQVAATDDICAIALTPKGHIVFVDNGYPKCIKMIEDNFSYKTIFQDVPGNEVLHIPWHICINSKGELVLVDCDRHTVVIFSMDGQIIARYQKFETGELEYYPEGICIVRYDDIFVCDRNRECVHHLDSKGGMIDYVLPGMDSTALLFKEPYLYVGMSDGDIVIYKLY